MAGSVPGGVPASKPDALAGGLFIALGAFGLWAGRDLEMGTLAAMGSGYLPRALSAGVVLIGLFVLALSLRGKVEPISVVRLRPIAMILIAIGGFAVAASYFGFIVATAWVVGVGSLADKNWRAVELVWLVLGLTVFAVAVFIYGLGVQMKLGPF
jgi:hypothetical protein